MLSIINDFPHIFDYSSLCKCASTYTPTKNDNKAVMYYVSSQNYSGKGCMMEKSILIQEPRTSFFGIIKREEELDDSTFNEWKSELQKELPVFWEEMNSKRIR